ncbi:hypothetical protein WN944_023720 [Citrus x changshan-huyou]|uniref:Uncharacterized protein n=1 Tax=Citrus x changshan-huyou TaxID=2935761 RepID=A0AAP0N0U6_9ROSI
MDFEDIKAFVQLLKKVRSMRNNHFAFTSEHLSSKRSRHLRPRDLVIRNKSTADFEKTDSVLMKASIMQIEGYLQDITDIKAFVQLLKKVRSMRNNHFAFTSEHLSSKRSRHLRPRDLVIRNKSTADFEKTDSVLMKASIMQIEGYLQDITDIKTFVQLLKKVRSMRNNHFAFTSEHLSSKRSRHLRPRDLVIRNKSTADFEKTDSVLMKASIMQIEGYLQDITDIKAFVQLLKKVRSMRNNHFAFTSEHLSSKRSRHLRPRDLVIRNKRTADFEKTDSVLMKASIMQIEGYLQDITACQEKPEEYFPSYHVNPYDKAVQE